MKRVGLIYLMFMLVVSAQAITPITFYGHDISLYSDRFPQISPPTLTPTGIKAFEQRLDEDELEKLVNELNHHTRLFNLDDVGKVQLVKAVTKAIYPDQLRNQVLRWKVLDRMGYRVMFTYDGSTASTFGVLGFTSNNSVYMMIKGERYTNLDFKDYRVLGKRKVYGNVYQGRAIYMDLRKKPKLNALKRKKELQFIWDNRSITISAEGNRSLSNYLNDLPTLDFSNAYVAYGVSDELKSTLFRQLEEEMIGMDQKERLSFLLKFVQTAFKYAPDGRYRGEEKYSYPEETVFDSYSDCEDRAMLLACLYKELLGLDSIALLFQKQNHLSMAVNVPGTTVGGTFRYEGRAYYVCEPAGINFTFGKSGYDLTQITKVYPLY